MFDQQAIDDYNKKIQEEANRREALLATKQVSETVEAVRKAVDFSTSRLIADKRVNPQKVQVLNNLATPEDISKVTEALDKLAVALKPIPSDDSNVVGAIEKLRAQIEKLPTELPEVEKVEEVSIKNIVEFKNYIKPLLDAVNKLELNPTFDPRIEVKPADVKVTTEKVDTTPLLKAIEGLSKEFTKLSEKEQPETDLEPLLKATKATTDAVKNMTFPVPNYVLPFSKDGKATQITLNTDGTLPTGSANYKTEVDTATANIVYIGKAPIGSSTGSGVWQIKRVDLTTTNAIESKYAASGAFTATWTNRASETYS